MKNKHTCMNGVCTTSVEFTPNPLNAKQIHDTHESTHFMEDQVQVESLIP